MDDFLKLIYGAWVACLKKPFHPFKVQLNKGEGDARLLEELINMLIKNPVVAAMAEKSQEEIIRNKAQHGAGGPRPLSAATSSPLPSSSSASSATSAIRAEDLEALMMNEAASSSRTVRRASQPTPVPETLTRNAVLDEILGSEGGEWSDMLEQTPEEEEDEERTRERLLRLYQLGTVPEAIAVPSTMRQVSPQPPPLPTFQSRFSSDRGGNLFLNLS